MLIFGGSTVWLQSSGHLPNQTCVSTQAVETLREHRPKKPWRYNNCNHLKPRNLYQNKNQKNKTNNLFLTFFMIIFFFFHSFVVETNPRKNPNLPAFVSSLDLSWFLRSSDRKLGELELKSWNLDHSWDFVVLDFGWVFSLCLFVGFWFLFLFGCLLNAVWGLCLFFLFVFLFVCVWCLLGGKEDSGKLQWEADFWGGLCFGFKGVFRLVSTTVSCGRAG